MVGIGFVLVLWGLGCGLGLVSFPGMCLGGCDLGIVFGLVLYPTYYNSNTDNPYLAIAPDNY